MNSPESATPGAGKVAGSVLTGSAASGPRISPMYLTMTTGLDGLPLSANMTREEAIQHALDAISIHKQMFLPNESHVRSRALLMRNLTPEQQVTFELDRFIDVVTKSGRTYRIWCYGSVISNIHWIKRNKVLCKFCIAPKGSVNGFTLPCYDAYLGQLLLLRTDEKQFLKIAIPSSFRHPHPVRGAVRKLLSIFF